MDECEEGVNDCDPMNGVCTNTAGGYACSCVDGWELSSDGVTCRQIISGAQIAAGGGHTCVLKTDDTVACWGSNYSGQTTPPSGAFLQLSAGDRHICGVRTDGTVACWGSNTIWGADDGGQSTPPSGTFLQVSAGGNPYVCGLRTDNTLTCWGSYVR